MTTFIAESALLPQGWAENVLIEIDTDGWIVGVHPGNGEKDSGAEYIPGPVLPGMANAHSHAFQRAMAGLAERGSRKKGNFWSWRETMYRFLEQIGPEALHAIAGQLYVEMLKAGFTAVGEFHYLHHQPDGRPYEDRAVLSRHIIQAAQDTGIAITHMPVLYYYGGFGNAKSNKAQYRFLNKPQEIWQICETLQKDFGDNPQVDVGFAYHSLRAVSPEMMQEMAIILQESGFAGPVHIHAAEQMGEVEGCIEWSGKRPVEWLLENGGMNENWCVVHATHMTDAETTALAQSGVTVALCPTTEANLGDGVFPLTPYLEHGGRFAIGSDSHISVSVVEELRWLEYVQRLFLQERTIVQSDEVPSVGAWLYERALDGGHHCLGRSSGKIEVGHRADLIVVDDSLPVFVNKFRDHILDAMVFAGNVNPIRDVMVGGRWVVKKGRHVREDEIFRRYADTLRALG